MYSIGCDLHSKRMQLCLVDDDPIYDGYPPPEEAILLERRWRPREGRPSEMVARLKTTPGLGQRLSMHAALEIVEIDRFAGDRNYVSCCELAPGTHERTFSAARNRQPSGAGEAPQAHEPKSSNGRIEHRRSRPSRIEGREPRYTMFPRAPRDGGGAPSAARSRSDGLTPPR